MSWFYDDGVECRGCGCDWNHACYDVVTGDGCYWVEEDLCSVCARARTRNRWLGGIALFAAALAFALALAL